MELLTSHVTYMAQALARVGIQLVEGDAGVGVDDGVGLLQAGQALGDVADLLVQFADVRVLVVAVGLGGVGGVGGGGLGGCWHGGLQRF